MFPYKLLQLTFLENLRLTKAFEEFHIFLILIMQVFLFLAQMSVSFIQSWIFLHLTTRINISLVSDFFINLMNLPLSFFDRKLTGDILQRIGDNYRIQNFLTGPTLSTFFSFFNLIVFSIIMLIYSQLIFFIFVISSTLYIIWIFLFLKKRSFVAFIGERINGNGHVFKNIITIFS